MEKGIKAKGKGEKAILDPKVLVSEKESAFLIVWLGFIE